jgi:hypothetical protein
MFLKEGGVLSVGWCWGGGGLVGGGCCGGELFELDMSRFWVSHCGHRSAVGRAKFAGEEGEGRAETVRRGDYER